MRSIIPNPLTTVFLREGWRVLFAALVVWSVILTAWIYWFTVRDAGMPGWDDYDRCAWGAAIWITLVERDLALFWNYTHQQFVWPFLHSWITGALFYLFGPTVNAARLLALASYLGTALLMLLWFHTRGQRAGTASEDGCLQPIEGVGAVIAWALFTTFAMPLQHAGSVMSELPGFFLVALALSVCPRISRGALMGNLLAGVIVGALFWYKYNYAALTYIGLAAARALQERRDPMAAINLTNATLFGLPPLMLAVWMLPNLRGKLEGLIYFTVNNPEARIPMSWEGLLYYPSRIPNEYFAHPLFCYASLALILAAIPFTKRLSLSRPLVMCFWIHFLAAMLHPMKDIRFMFIPMGLFFLMVGEAAVGLLERVGEQRRVWKMFPIAGLTLLAVVAAALWQTDLHRSPHATDEYRHLGPIYAVLDQLQEDDRPAFLSSHDMVIPPAINYYLTVERGRVRNPMDGRPFWWSTLFLFARGESVRSMELEDRFAALRHELWLNQADMIVTIQSTQPWKIANFDNLFGGTHEFANLPPFMGEFEMTFEREFRHIDALVRVFRLRGEEPQPLESEAPTEETWDAPDEDAIL